jgi:adenylate kinase
MTSSQGPKLLILGQQGSGKGTQGARLSAHLGVVHLSTGDILRAAVEARSPLGRRAGRFLGRGELVPDEMMLAVIEARLALPDTTRKGFLLDGFPRTLPQAKRLVAALEPDGLDTAILLDVPRDLAIERMLARGRADDTPESISRRLELYDLQTLPVHRFLDDLGLLVKIDATGTPDEVFDRIRRALHPLLWGLGKAVG